MAGIRMFQSVSWKYSAMLMFILSGMAVNDRSESGDLLPNDTQEERAELSAGVSAGISAFSK